MAAGWPIAVLHPPAPWRSIANLGIPFGARVSTPFAARIPAYRDALRAASVRALSAILHSRSESASACVARRPPHAVPTRAMRARVAASRRAGPQRVVLLASQVFVRV